ncbi:hypothetical protein [Roseibium salinum]|uniref:Uncharacterized protein n=1 Tax=Roseibium salinum TaxID=1604349 RepID=A0ABT3R8C3_9HYPH|nr:hypothetical protein [Roseibium sp. DSM 29163]MCX2725300.1 hypothetical protein [Roseibium sp. DSM 29163]MDN3720844.1 hypothetical protein [Roseibium salinum]
MLHFVVTANVSVQLIKQIRSSVHITNCIEYRFHCPGPLVLFRLRHEVPAEAPKASVVDSHASKIRPDERMTVCVPLVGVEGQQLLSARATRTYLYRNCCRNTPSRAPRRSPLSHLQRD